MAKLPKLPHGVIWVVDTFSTYLHIIMPKAHYKHDSSEHNDYWDVLLLIRCEITPIKGLFRQLQKNRIFVQKFGSKNLGVVRYRIKLMSKCSETSFIVFIGL